jgi:hypothetical protein
MTKYERKCYRGLNLVIHLNFFQGFQFFDLGLNPFSIYDVEFSGWQNKNSS